jgi:PAS domain S-box-containing protein
MKDLPPNATPSLVRPLAQCAADSLETMAPLRADWTRLLAWLPIPLLLAVIAGLWVADLRTAYESRTLMVLLNVFFTWLASLCVCFLTAHAFLGSGQPGLLMFGCGSLLWGVTSLAAAVIVDRVNPTVTVHNAGVLGAALCHFVGSLWRGRLPRPAQWLVLGYAGALMAAALIVWGAMAGLTPVFFVQGHGGTPPRQAVLLLATALFAWVAWQLIYRFRRQFGAFYYWYGLGLALVATGLTGVMLLSVQGGILGWTNRLTQYLGSAYLFIAALTAARQTGTWTFSLAAVNEALQKYWFTADYRRQQPLQRLLRYAMAVVAVAAGFGLRLALEARFGPGLPPFITFYPAVMAVALLAGFGPCLVAMALSACVVGYWVMPPVGQFAIASPVDRLGLVIFAGMGLLMGVVTELHRRYRHKAAAYDREAALRESQARLAAFAEATFEGIAQSEAGRIVDCNEQLARMLGYSVAELQGMEIANLIAPEDRERVMAHIQPGRASSVEHAMLCKDGTRIVVESHGRPVFPGSARRHTAIRDITARKRVEESLQTSMQRLYSILSSLYGSILLVTNEGKVEFANHSFCDLFNLKVSPQDLLGLAPDEMIGRIKSRYEYPAEAVARIRELVSRGQPIKSEEVTWADGRTLLRDFIPIDLEGRPFGRLWHHIDITDRKRREERIAKLTRLYAVLSRVNETIVRTRNAETLFSEVCRIVATNGEFPLVWIGEVRDRQVVPVASAGSASDYLEGIQIEIDGPLGLGPAGTCIRENRTVVNDDFSENPQTAPWRAAAQRFGFLASAAFPIRRCGKPVAKLSLYSREAGAFDAEQVALLESLSADLSFALDALEQEEIRAHAEADLHVSREKLSLALRSASMGVWRLDLRSQQRYFDEQVCRCLGIDPAHFAGTEEEFFAAVHPDDCQGLRNALAQTIAGGAAYEVEYRAVWPDGSLHYIAARGQLARDANGQPLWIDGLVWDVTERKRAEEALKESETRIRHSLAEKEILLKEIHHRVKNNMQVISSLVALQAERLPDAAMREVLQDVTHRVRSMALVHEKLYQSADMARVEFAEYAQSLLNYLWRAHGNTAAGVRLALDLEPVPLSVNSAVPFGLVLNELASNALKHAFRGRADGEVSVVLRGCPEGRVCLRVRDNGAGLPAGLDWRRADTLGLRLVQMLAGQLHATVEVCSGNGTEFTVAFGGPRATENGRP